MVLIARSARFLAEAAAAVGYRVHVVDAYGDVDAIAASASTTLLEGEHHWTPEYLLAQLSAWRGVPVVYGAGLESRSELLEALGRQHPMVGNRPEVLARINDPSAWFSALSALGIAHPETRFEPPQAQALADAAWLAKRARSAGGQHVVWSPGTQPMSDTYWQRHLRGRSCSVWFVADGKQVQILGGVRHLQFQPTRQWPFRMSGAVRLPMSTALLHLLHRSLGHLTQHFSLRGMNGLDFILDPDDQVSVVEINARPPSTLGMISARRWFDWHVAASAGHKVAIDERCHHVLPCAAQAVVYCPHDQALLHPVHALGWVHDQPPTRRMVTLGEPCFTVSAKAASPLAAVGLLRTRVKHLLRACLQPSSV